MSQNNQTDNASRRVPERSNTNGTRLDVFLPKEHEYINGCPHDSRHEVTLEREPYHPHLAGHLHPAGTLWIC
ncbi:hypothetical protein [Spirosoma jeollabukense]